MRVKEDRSFWVYLLLSILTCGIYSIYFWYVYIEDLNTIFYGDNDDSPNYIIVWLLTCITCGIYGVYWYYRQANRIYRESYSRYGVQINENGNSILLWFLLGYVTGGIGQLIACYFMITNLNRVATAFNDQQRYFENNASNYSNSYNNFYNSGHYNDPNQNGNH